MPTRARKRLCFDLFAVVLALTLFFSLTACKITGSHVAPPNTALSVHFIDVGQGDCALIETQGHYMLIDGGERGSEAAVIKYLKRLKVQRLDYVVATHPHSDHIGGLAYGVLEEFPVGTIIAPK